MRGKSETAPDHATRRVDAEMDVIDPPQDIAIEHCGGVLGSKSVRRHISGEWRTFAGHIPSSVAGPGAAIPPLAISQCRNWRYGGSMEEHT